MTPQEQELVSELFDRLAELQSNPRDRDAERLIADGLRRAPHAVYALVQTTLVQDEALKRANARIEELQAQVGGEEQQRSGGFLDSMRDAVLGSASIATALSPLLGYEASTALVAEAIATGASIPELIRRAELLDNAVLARVLSPENLCRPNDLKAIDRRR